MANREFVQFLSNAKGSAGEIKSQLYVALDAGFLAEPRFSELYQMTDDTGRLIGSFMRYLQSSPLRGQKFNQ